MSADRPPFSLENAALQVLSLLRARGSGRAGSTSPRAATVPELAARLGRPLRVAVVRNDGIGDWVLALPLMTALRDSADVGEILMVAPTRFAKLLNPDGDYAFAAFDTGTLLAPDSSGLLGKIRAISFLAGREARRLGAVDGANVDLVILPRWESDLGFNARIWAFASSGLVAGHSPQALPRPFVGERYEAARMDIAVVDGRTAAHEVDHLSRLLGALGLDETIPASYGASYWHTPPAPLDSRRVLIHPSANEAKRRWPATRWREVVTALLAEEATTVEILGGPADAVLIDEIIGGLGPRVTGLPGTIPLHELPTHASGARLFIGNDSGPAHVAASVGVPAVVVSPHPADGDASHRNSPSRFRPVGSAVTVLQPDHALAPCRVACVATEAHCITEITVEQVLSAAAGVAPRRDPS